jgi:pentatricopeptide repeat protein
LASSHSDSLREAYDLLQEFLLHDAIVPRKRAEEEDEAKRINNAYAAVNHALLEQYNHNHDIHKHTAAPYLEKAAMLEQQMLAWFKSGTYRQPDTNSMNARISLMSAKGNVDGALALLHTMIEAEDKGDTSLAPNQTSYNTALYGCAKVGDDERARDTLHLMISRQQRKLSSVVPNVASFNGLLNAYSNNGKADAGVKQNEYSIGWNS